jgi:hypothetical protein
MDKVTWSGQIVSVQPRIRLTRSFDERYHSYLGYCLFINGVVDGERREFSVGIGKGAHNRNASRLKIPQKPHRSLRFMPSCLVVVLILLLTSSCTSDASDTFKNPDFSCPSSKVVEPTAGYPHPIQQYPFAPNDYARSVTELQDFCSRMKQHFANSNLKTSESEQFYSLLREDNNNTIPWLHNECYGMPGCERKPFVINEQVMLKKITDEKYQVFYYYIGCGVNYDYMEIYLKQGNIDKYVLLERWSESFPC